MLHKRICEGRSSTVGTVGQWADSGGWDYFVKHELAHKSQKRRSDCQHHVTAQQCRGITANSIGVSDYSSANGKGKNKEAYL